MHSTRKGEQISQKFLQLLSQTLCYWSIFSFSGLPLKGVTPKLPFLNARTLGVLRLSYNLKLVSQYRQGKHPLDWLLSSIPVTFRTMGAGDVCVSISSQQSFLCCTESLSPLTKPFLLSSVFGEHSMVHKFSFQISPEQVSPSPGFISVCSVANRISPVMQLQLHIRALLGKHRARAMALECLKEQFRDITLHQCRPLMPM